jgi:hypothetical protein
MTLDILNELNKPVTNILVNLVYKCYMDSMCQ